MKETEIAKAAVQWLTADGWEVYQEVATYSGGPIVDLIATKGPLLWVLESKTSFGLTVIRQAQHWCHRAHFVSVVVPHHTKHNINEYDFAKRICDGFGIGVLRMHLWQTGVVEEWLAPKLYRKANVTYLRSKLNERQKTYAEAGNANGKRWTPFQETCENLRIFVAKNPGACLKEAIDSINTHYQTKGTARACIKQWAELGKISGVRIEKQGKFLKLFPAEVA